MKGIIYVAENTVNGKRYVGQTIRKFEERQAHHKKDSEVCDFKFYRAIRKYGWDNFNWAVIVEGVESVESLNSLEQYWIKELDTFKNGYNSTTGGEGYIVSAETKKKMSESQKGKHLSEEHRKKISESRKGKHFSEETKKKISESRKGRHFSEETRRKLSESHKGKQFSEETKKKISERLKGEKNPNYGKHLSDETKKKMSESHKGRTGANNPCSKPVLQLDKETGEVIAEFAGLNEAERVTGIHNGHISRVCRGEQKSSGGYYWQYKEEEREEREEIAV